MHKTTHRSVTSNGVRLHLAECGTGPIVLLVHGFPESWYSWRYQLPALAQAGYRAIACDVRGYGRSSKPARVSDYRMLQKVADIVGLVAALGDEPITLVGHDWGAPIVWNSALLRPELFRGVAGLSVPYAPPTGRDGMRPTEAMKLGAIDDEFYISYFQRVGRAEKEIEQNIREWLLGFYWCGSGDIVDGPNISRVDNGKTMRDKFQYPSVMPNWLTDADLDIYTAEFEYSGFFGPLNRYRCVDQDWQDLAAHAGQPITIPALFIGGSRDGPTIWGAQAIEQFPTNLPKLTRSEILEGSGHWIQQERHQETNELLIEFLGTLHT